MLTQIALHCRVQAASPSRVCTTCMGFPASQRLQHTLTAAGGTLCRRVVFHVHLSHSFEVFFFLSLFYSSFHLAGQSPFCDHVASIKKRSHVMDQQQQQQYCACISCERSKPSENSLLSRNPKLTPHLLRYALEPSSLAVLPTSMLFIGFLGLLVR